MSVIHDANKVSSPDFLDVLLTELAFQQLAGEVGELRGIGQSYDATVTIEVCAQSHMVDTHHVDGMLQMAHSILYRGLPILHEESFIQGDLHHTTLCCQGTHLVVSKVAGMVAQGTATAMAAYDGCLAQFQGVVKTLLVGMTEVDHDTQTVHFPDDLLAKVTHTAPCLTTSCGVADIVVAIVTERHIDDAPLGKVPQVLYLSIQRMTVLNTEHDALLALMLIHP